MKNGSAPLFWRSELRNLLSIYLRKEILELIVVLHATEEAEQLMDANEFEVNSTQVMSLVADSSCSAYNYDFVALADDLNVQLVTFDKKLSANFLTLQLVQERLLCNSNKSGINVPADEGFLIKKVSAKSAYEEVTNELPTKFHSTLLFLVFKFIFR